MSYTRKVAYNASVQFIGKVVTTIVSLITIAILTRSLGVAGFGEYTTAFAYVNFVAVFIDLGFFTILVREIIYAKHPADKIVNNVLTLKTAIALTGYGVAFLIAQFLPYPPVVKLAIGLSALAIFWLSLNMTIVALFQANFRIDKGVFTDALGRFIILGLVYFLSRQDASLYLILSAYVVANFTNFALNVILARQYVRIRPAFDLAFWKLILRETLPMGVLVVISYIIFKIDLVILSLLKPSYDVGIYGTGYKVLEIILTIPTMFIGTVFPVITKYFDQKDDRLYASIQKSFDFMNLLAWPIVIGTIILSGPIIQIIGGQQFVNAHTVSFLGHPITAATTLSLVIIAATLSFNSILFYNTVIAIKKQRALILPNLFIAAFNITLNFIFIRYWSYLAAAVITILSEILVLLFAYIVYRRHLSYTPRFNNFAKYMVSAVFMGIFLYIFRSQNFFLLLAIAIVIYGSIVLITGGIDRQIIRQLLKSNSEQ